MREAAPLVLGGAPPLFPTPRVIAVRGLPSVFQLMDFEASVLPGVRGIQARRLATLCGYEAPADICETRVPSLPAREPSWTAEAVQHGLVSCGANLHRGGGVMLPALARLCAARGSTLTYHVPPLPEWFRTLDGTHLALALATGCVDLIEHANGEEYNRARRLAAEAAGGALFVPDGGSWGDQT